MNIAGASLMAGASFLGGVVNAVAGGGTLLAFPAALAAGLSPLAANATNAVAMVPASLTSAWGYRAELREERARLRVLAPPAVLGGVLGSVLLLRTPGRVLDDAVPLLVLFATAMLVLQNVLSARGPAAGSVRPRPALAAVLQFAVGVYGGYFGAGMGFMMLALFGLLGDRNIHRMNAVRSALAAAINGIAAVAFVAAGAVDYRALVVMALGGALGGWVGAAAARRASPRVVRWLVVALGVVLSAVLSYRRWG